MADVAGAAGDLDRRLADCGGTDLTALLSTARRRGLAVAASLAAFRRQLAVAGAVQLESARLWRMLTSRMLAGVGLGVLARAYLVGLAPPAAWASARGRDAVLQVTAALVVAAVLRGLARTLPVPWTGTGPLAPAAVAWLAAHAGMPAASGGTPASSGDSRGEIAAIWRSASLRELASGVSLARERREHLAAWARSRALADRERCRSLEDWLPLLELAGIGLPVALLLLAPTVAWLARDAPG
jgi:hypothetical protein